MRSLWTYFIHLVEPLYFSCASLHNLTEPMDILEDLCVLCSLTAFPVSSVDIVSVIDRASLFPLAAEEVDLSQDLRNWETLTDSEKHFISHVLAFFAQSDGIVLENLAARFLNDVQIPEVTIYSKIEGSQ